MEQTTFPIHKSRPMRPFLSTHLATSTPDSHQFSKRIKGLFGYSEHYKGNRVNDDFADPSFPPLRTRDYRKSRELTLEIWDPMIQISFLEKFLKGQNNLHTIRIKVLTKEYHKGEILKRLCGILYKFNRLNRVHIDFDTEQDRQVKPELFKEVRSLRKLPKFKDLEVTLDGEQASPFSTNLVKVGFDSDNGFAAKDMNRLIQKALKFHHLDTLKFGSKPYFISAGQFADGLVLVLSKLPNFRELNLDFFKDSSFSLQQTFNILDTLAKAPKFEILRLGFPMLGKFQISLLKHPFFKAKSLKITSFSLVFHSDHVTSEDLSQVLDLLEEIPSLYEVSLRFIWQSEIAEGEMEKISRMTSIRKLNVVLNHSSRTLSRKLAGNIFRSILKMHWLEELNLWLLQGCLELNLGNIQGLSRLRKVSLSCEKWRSEGTKDLLAVVEIFGKYPQLRELELNLGDSIHDHQGVTMKLIESLRKLKRLEVFKFYALMLCRRPNITMDLFEDLVMTCHQLRNLQDLTIQMLSLSLSSSGNSESYQRCENLHQRLSTNKKYRHFDLACVY